MYTLSRMFQKLFQILAQVLEQKVTTKSYNKFSGCNELRAILLPVLGNDHVTYTVYQKFLKRKS